MEDRKNNPDPRDIVIHMLEETLDQGEFSHLVLRRTLEEVQLNRQDQIFAGRLFHGVLEQLLFLDWIISSYSKIRDAKLRPVIRHILRISVYQMLFMDSVPDRAAVYEAVRLTKKRGLNGLAPFVNGLLRSFQRGGIKPGMPEHIKKSMPLWLYEKLRKELGEERAEAFFDAAGRPQEYVYARLLLSRAAAEDIIALLERDGCRAEPVPSFPEAVRLFHAGNLKDLDAFRQGLIFIQDLSSMQVGRFAAGSEDPEQVRKIIDVCAAPGGKSLHLAEKFPDAEILARDLSEMKVKQIRENRERCGCGNLTAEVHDALEYDADLAGSADILLADLPCSGIGVIGRKPDIRLRIREEDLKELEELQRKILSTVSGYVREGGLLIYSTCTVNRQENQENAEWFEKNFPFEKIYEKQYLPGEDACDGFYLSCFRKSRIRS